MHFSYFLETLETTNIGEILHKSIHFHFDKEQSATSHPQVLISKTLLVTTRSLGLCYCWNFTLIDVC